MASTPSSKSADNPEIDLETVDGRRRLPAVLADLIAQDWETPDAKTRLDAGRERLSEEVALARRANIYPLISAGNDGLPDAIYEALEKEAGPEARATLESQHRNVLSGIPGLRSIGATGVGEGPSSSDDTMADFSSPGANIATLGDDIPVGAPNPFAVLGGAPNVAIEADGTSFSAPYTGGVIALMVAAHPAITPDEIDQILDATARDRPGSTRDGRGVLDEVAAARGARALTDR